MKYLDAYSDIKNLDMSKQKSNEIIVYAAAFFAVLLL